jgi:hypothetical protein
VTGADGEGPSMVATLAKSLVLLGTVVARNAGRQLALTMGGYLAVAGLFAISLGFLTLSGYRAISSALGSIYASLIVGCIYLIIALFVALVLQVRRR